MKRGPLIWEQHPVRDRYKPDVLAPSSVKLKGKEKGATLIHVD